MNCFHFFGFEFLKKITKKTYKRKIDVGGGTDSGQISLKIGKIDFLEKKGLLMI